MLNEINNNSGVYRILNKITGECYIGGTKAGFRQRSKQHLRSLRKGTHYTKKLQKAFNEYGESSFIFEIVDEYNRNIVFDMEQYWVNLIRPEYNTTYNIKTVVMDDIARLKVSKSRGGRPFEVYENDTLLKTYNIRRECAEELKLTESMIHRCLKGKQESHKGYKFKYVGEDFSVVLKKERKSQKGRFVSEDSRKKMSEARKGKTPWNKGKKTGNNQKSDTVTKARASMIKNGTRAGKLPKKVLLEKDGVLTSFLTMQYCADYINVSISYLSKKLKNNKDCIIRGYKLSILQK